ncbi:hypothetical protein Psfp_02082 [Pelotomaculum sp. FP]|uniref:hypothetical protein n=1 Tax=Pelotomaculum sp. FP TaxID=261474 RepID=UPI001064BA0D|nr:hypothetical protein [Pelotomaculum sp. FP]TEB15587.1 hypothetical protein Psfp_02082 [Pelotomaculum sp. FP]
MRKIVVLLFAFCIIVVPSAYAADAEYRFTHNDHDTLIIGKITELSNETIVIQAVDYIVSARDLNVNAKKKQLRPEVVKLTSDSVKQFNEVIQPGILSKLGVGDSVVTSLNKKGDKYSIAWGLFKADSTDYKTLSVEAYNGMQSAMIKDFINSGGKYTEFAFDGQTNTVYRIETGEDNTQKRAVIYQGTGGTENLAAIDNNTPNELSTTLKTNYTQYIAYGITGAIILVLLFNIISKKHSRRENIE